MGNILNPYSILSQEIINIVNYANSNRYTLPSNLYPLDNLIQELKKNNIWQKLDVFYVFAGGGSAEFKLINIINPSVHYATAYGGLTWNNYGVLGNGTNSWIDTNYNPATSGINYQLNNASIFGVIATNNAAPYAFTVQRSSGGYNQLANYSGNAIRINAGTSAPISTNADLSGPGFKSISRTSSTNVELVSTSNNFLRTQNSLAVDSNSQRLLQRDGVSTTHLISSFGMGAALTYSETQTFRTAFNNYLTAIGETPVA